MKKIFFLLTISLTTISCADLLDTEPTDFYTSDTYWQTEAHALEALTGTYSALVHKDLYNENTVFMFECMTPNAFHKDNYKSTGDFARGSHSGTTEGMALSMWNGAYRGIGRANSVLNNVPNIKMNEDLKKRIIAEATFLRAFLYSKINVLFNGVPLVLNSDVESNSHLPRSTYQQVKDQILKDLDYAISILPSKYDDNNKGRVTKGAALALKARVLLQDHDYTNTISVIEELISLNQYSLFPDYNGIFRKANQGNSEIIFDIRFQAPEITNDYDIIHAQFNVQAPVQELVDIYEMADGKTITQSPLYNNSSPYTNRDPRFEQTILYIGAPWRERQATEVDLHQTGYAFRKYTEYNASTSGTISNSDVNYIEIRYADVLLMYAEAINELYGPTSTVYQSINQIRNRPTVDMPPIANNLSQEEMRQVIRKERRIELAGEGSYFYDIRRWKTIDFEMNAQVHDHKYNVKETRKFNPQRDYHWPIPYTQIDLNRNLTQNPGY